jgi:hypothetical protein
MRHKLFFGAALLVPALAYCGNTSVDLSVEILPASLAPEVPAGAKAAGFTTLALNSDFTHQLPSNWLGGCSVAGNGQSVSDFFADDTGHTWWMNIWWAYNYQPCLTVQRQDPNGVDGLVLDMPWTVDNAYTKVGTVIETASWDYNASIPRGTANSFPIGSYYEVVARISPSSASGTYMVFLTWGPGGIADQNCGCTMEWDIMETSDNTLDNYDSAIHNWGAGGAGNFILQPWNNLAPGTNFDASKYNTYGLRVTYDGALSAVGCTYVNNVFQACAPLPNLNSTEQNARNFLLLGNGCDYWHQPNQQCNQGQAQHVYVKSIRVWSCANWQSTQCSGTVLTGAP